MKNRSLKQRLISALLALVMMITSLLGTTFAWFTDEVTSAGNKIETGSLKVDLLHKVDENWISLKDNPAHKVFDYDKWEPGYTKVESLKIDNLGRLALQYRLSIEMEYGTAKLGDKGENLADVIDVYVTYGESTAKSIDEITASNTWIHKGTLSEVMKNPASFMGGQLLPTGEVLNGTVTANTAVGSQVMSIALHMQESVGNEYQELSVGDIYVNLLATQWSYEDDSFGNSYDEDAIFPEINIGGITVDVMTENNVVTQSATVNGNGVMATIPTGVAVQDGVTKLGLSVTEKTESDANLTLNDGEALRSLDVHMDGVADENTVPMLITIEKAMKVGLNIGNYTLYHVEDGVSIAMTAVNDPSELDAHNEFYYDPATGDVTLAMATFSEVAMVAEQPTWKGNRDYSWYTNAVAPVTEGEPDYIIANADQLAALSAIVGGMDGQTQDSFQGKYIKLVADINLGDKNNANENLLFYPIGYYNNTGSYDKVSGKVTVDGEEVAVSSYYQPFAGMFDGNGNTIANFYQNTWEMFGDYNDGYSGTPNHSRDGMGLFGKVYGGTVKNLTVEGFSSDGEFATTGVIAAYADSGNGKSATFENIAILDCNPRVYNIGNGGIVGCVGWYSRSDATANGYPVVFRNITVDQTNMISALWGSYDVSCGGILGQYYPDSQCGVSFENCHIAAVMDVNNDVCANYQYYWYRYSGMLIGTIRANKTEGGYTVADTTGITVDGCTYTLGDWNEYWYCELVKNSLASYTHDHQFSRLTKIESLDEIKSGQTWLKEGNFVLPAKDNSSAVCYHIFKDSEGNLYEHKHDSADESNDYNPYETFDLNGDGELNDLKEDRQCYYMPFNQVFNGLGYGVKPTYEITGLTEVTDGPVNSEEKFDALDNFPTYRPGDKFTLGELVSAVVDESKISKATLYVAVSPATEADNVSGTVSVDTGDWTNTTITFAEDCVGVAKIVITDYFYCKKTVIYLNPEEAAAKFTANPVASQNAYSQIALGTLFAANADTAIGNVTATVTDPNGDITTVTGTNTDWTTQTINLAKDGTWTVVIKDDDAYCSVTTATFTVNKVDKFEVAFDHDEEAEGKQNNVDTYLYRVGNQNAVTLGSLFSELEADVNVSSVTIFVKNVAGDVTYTFTPATSWTSGTIKFTGTGVVAVMISADGANKLTLNLEVVDATNITSATAGTGKDFVLLQDVTYSGTYLYYKDSTLYGNGFTIDITGADHNDLKDTSDTSSNKSAYCNIWMVDSRFDNVQIVGSVYPEVGMTADSDYGNAAIRTEGDCYITNSYISNCRVPLRVQGNTTLIDTVVDGGRYANIELRSGKLTLDGVTTINTVRKGSDDTTEVIGFGIVIHSEAANASISVVGDGLKQYNWVGEEKHKTTLSGDTYLSNAYKLIFNANNNETIYFDYNDDRYVNTGILCLCADITKDAVIGLNDRYCQEVSGYDAWVLTYDNSKHSDWFNESVSTESVAANHKQHPVIPNYSGNEAQTIEFTKGETYDFDTSVLTAEKFGQNLTISSVVMNGTTYKYGDKIAITEGGVYEIVYTVDDPYNYDADASVTESVNHTVFITVTAVVKDAEILAPKFTFIDQNGNKYESTTVKVGDKTYVMPNVTAADPTTNSMSSINIGSVSISGTTVYFPIATGYTVRSGSNFNRYYPLFNGINITDYTIAGDTTGTTYTTSGNYTSLVGSSGKKFIIPANGGQTNCGDYVKTDGQAGNAAGNSDSGWQGAGYSTSYGGTYLKSGNTNASSGADSNGYERIVWVEYCFNAGNGDVYYYRIGYHCNKESAQTCITPDTLITLADGTQVRVDSLTGSEELLVWNMETGKLDKAPVAYIVNHNVVVSEQEVICLTFANGKTVKIIGEHVFFDVTMNRYVALDSANVDSYIGHTFAALGEDGNSMERVALVSVTREVIETTVYEVVSYQHLICFTEGILSTSAYLDPLLNVFDVDSESLSYNAESVQQDIETYGLYTYEDFQGLISEEAFELYNAAYLKVAVGKGYITWNDILDLIDIYFDAGVIPLND